MLPFPVRPKKKNKCPYKYGNQSWTTSQLCVFIRPNTRVARALFVPPPGFYFPGSMPWEATKLLAEFAFVFDQLRRASFILPWLFLAVNPEFFPSYFYIILI
jgi:hypothetical protein